MQRLVFVTQVIDPAHPILGITVDLVRALAAHLEVTVIANAVSAVPPDLPARVISLGKEAGAPRRVRTARYLRAIESATRESPAGRPAALLVHMCPIYLSLAAPIAKPRGVRLLLWYAQAAGGGSLALAERCASAILTSVPGAYPRENPGKLVAIGQAIDTEHFPFAPRERAGPLRLLALGRTAPVKCYPVAIRAVDAVRATGEDVRLAIVGPSTTPAEQAERARLRALIDELALGEAVQLAGPLPRAQVPAAIAACDALVNVTEDGSADKSVFEAMAIGRPVLTANPALGPLMDNLALPLRLASARVSDLAEGIRQLAAAAPGVANEVGWELRQRVLNSHSVEHWATGVVAQLSLPVPQGVER